MIRIHQSRQNVVVKYEVFYAGIERGQCGKVVDDDRVCEIPFDRLDSLSEELPELRGQLYRSMSKELRDDRRMMRLLSRKTADQRLASFLITLSDRFRRRGYSPYSFRLSMSRADMGNYLGLAVETVSRILSRFQQQNVVAVSGREVNILDMQRLITLAEEEAQAVNSR